MATKYDTHELAWAAGFFDGEGSVRAKWMPRRKPTHNPTRGIHAIVGQRDRHVLDRFQAAVGFGKVYGPYFTQTRDGAPMYRWETGSRDNVNAVALLLWRWLSPVKQQQFEDSFELFRSMSHQS
jgi:hypothetical protein